MNFTPHLLFWLILSCCISTVSAQEKKDYTVYDKAIEQLSKLGYPSVKGARYVRFSGDTEIEYFGELEEDLVKGMGFLCENEAGENTYFISLTGKVTDVSKKVIVDEYDDKVNVKSAKKVNLKKDLKMLLKMLKTPEAQEELVDAFEYSENTAVNLFLLACFSYEHGQKKLAAELLDQLLRVEEARFFLDRVISVVAHVKMTQALKDFVSHGDWVKYKIDVDNVIQSYPRGWDKYPAAVYLSGQLTNMIKGVKLTVPKMEGYTFNSQVKKEVLSKLLGRDNMRLNQYWMITHSQKKKYFSDYMEAFAVMAMLIDSDHLIKVSEDDLYESLDYYSYCGDDDYSLIQLYGNLPKTTSVGEVVSGWIRFALPHIDQRRELSRSELKDAALDWWKRNKERTNFEKIEALLSIGDINNGALLGMLIRDESAQAMALFEKTILESGDTRSAQSYVTMYVKKHRSDVKGFVDDYIKISKKEYSKRVTGGGLIEGSGLIGNNLYFSNSDQDIEKYIISLYSIMNPLSVEDFINGLKEGDLKIDKLKEKVQAMRISYSLNHILSDEMRSQIIIQASKMKPEEVITLMQIFNPDYSSDERLEGVKQSIKIGTEEEAAWRKLMAMPVTKLIFPEKTYWLDIGYELKLDFHGIVSNAFFFSTYGISYAEEVEFLNRFVENYLNGKVKGNSDIIKLVDGSDAYTLERELGKLGPENALDRFKELSAEERYTLFERFYNDENEVEWVDGLERYCIGVDSRMYLSNEKSKKQLHAFLDKEVLYKKIDSDIIFNVCEKLLSDIDNLHSGAIINFSGYLDRPVYTELTSVNSESFKEKSSNSVFDHSKMIRGDVDWKPKIKVGYSNHPYYGGELLFSLGSVEDLKKNKEKLEELLKMINQDENGYLELFLYVVEPKLIEKAKVQIDEK